MDILKVYKQRYVGQEGKEMDEDDCSWSCVKSMLDQDKNSALSLDQKCKMRSQVEKIWQVTQQGFKCGFDFDENQGC